MNTKLIIKENGKEEVYFSKDFVYEQIKLAYNSGFSESASKNINVYLNDSNQKEVLDEFLKEINKRSNSLLEKLIIKPKN